MASGSSNPDILEHLTCPICFEIPEVEVYQCSDGHVICSRCYFRTKNCPQCRVPFDPKKPIRNRHFEGLLEGLEVDCPFKSEGCTTKWPRKDFKKHKETCWFNYDKFGPFLNICSVMGYPDCTFGINNGYTEAAVKHFVKEHNAFLTKSSHFRMELADFQQVTGSSSANQIHFWTPIITDLRDKQCCVLIMAMLNKKDKAMSLLTLYLPYAESKCLSESPVQVKFTLSKDNHIDPLELNFIHEPITLQKVANRLSGSLPHLFKTSFLKGFFNKNGKFLIDCEIIEEKSEKKLERGKTLKRDNFICISRTAPIQSIWNVYDNKSVLVQRYFREQENICRQGRDNILKILPKLFDITEEDRDYIRNGLLFTVAEYGSPKAMKCLLDEGIPEIDVINQSGKTALHCAMEDKNLDDGLEKAKALVEYGANVNLQGNGMSLLHFAAVAGSKEAVEYFIEKGLKINGVDLCGYTPLHKVVSGREEMAVEMAKLLLEKGADPKIENKRGNSVLDLVKNYFDEESSLRNELVELLESVKPTEVVPSC